MAWNLAGIDLLASERFEWNLTKVILKPIVVIDG